MISAHRRLLRQDVQARQKQTDQIHLPLAISVSALIFIFLFVGTAFLVIVARTVGNVINPFAAYTALLANPSDVGMELVGFKCVSNIHNFTGSVFETCSEHPNSGPFSLVSVQLQHGTVRSVRFQVRRDALTLGDLVLWWHEPISFSCPAIGACRVGLVTIEAYNDAKVAFQVTGSRFSYSLPVHDLWITPSYAVITSPSL